MTTIEWIVVGVLGVVAYALWIWREVQSAACDVIDEPLQEEQNENE